MPRALLRHFATTLVVLLLVPASASAFDATYDPSSGTLTVTVTDPKDPDLGMGLGGLGSSKQRRLAIGPMWGREGLENQVRTWALDRKGGQPTTFVDNVSHIRIHTNVPLDLSSDWAVLVDPRTPTTLEVNVTPKAAPDTSLRVEHCPTELPAEGPLCTFPELHNVRNIGRNMDLNSDGTADIIFTGAQPELVSFEGTPTNDSYDFRTYKVKRVGGGYARLAVGGGAGNDTILTGWGGDQISDHDGNDLVNTGPGPDSVTTGRGTNKIYLGPGNDSIHFLSRFGTNIIRMGAGNDNVTAGGGNDTVYLGPGNDLVLPSGGNDTYYGESGNDRIFDNRGNDRLYGGPGKDKLDTGFKNTLDDIINCGPGTDLPTTYLYPQAISCGPARFPDATVT